MESRITIAPIGMFYIFWFVCALTCAIISGSTLGETGISATSLAGFIVGIVVAIKWKGGEDTNECIGWSIGWGIGIGIGIVACIATVIFAG